MGDTTAPLTGPDLKAGVARDRLADGDFDGQHAELEFERGNRGTK